PDDHDVGRLGHGAIRLNFGLTRRNRRFTMASVKNLRAREARCRRTQVFYRGRREPAVATG
ncbi:MAG TPA: hypothetical protein VG079_00420, partial [Gaiellaceae bacterium]|nr:hypothetical protein [Gaiellaceae bacterium]